MIDERTWILKKLEVYESRYGSDPFSFQSSNKTKSFIEQNKNCFLRSHLSGHVTGSAWIVNEDLDACLLVHHRKLGLWLQLGGHADGESNILEVALREAQEESGLHGFKILSEDIFDVDVHRIPARPEEPEHFHYDIRFLLQAPSSLPLSYSERESLGLAWVPLEEIRRNNLYQNVQRIADKSSSFFRGL